MATIKELSAEDFKAFQKDTTASQEYNSLAEDKQKKYEIEYTSKFSEELKKIRSQIMDSEQIDSKSAGQILLREIKRAHEQGNFFMDSSGNVDMQKFNQVKTSITRDVENGKYDNLIQRNQKETELKVNENENKQIDLNTPEGKKEFINNLYKGYSECKTLEDKKNYIQNDCGIPLDGMTDEQVENVVSAFDTRQDIRSIKDKLDKEAIKKENPNLDDEAFDKLLEDMAEQQYAEESGRDLEEVKAVNSEMVKLEELLADKAKLKSFNQDFSEIQEQIDEICDKLKLSPEELIEIQNENENEVENTENLNNKEKLDIIEEKLEISDSFENEENEIEQEEDLFDTEENQLENDEEILDLLDELLLEKKKRINDKQDFSEIQEQIDEICDKLKLSPEELIEIQNENENEVEDKENKNYEEKEDTFAFSKEQLENDKIDYIEQEDEIADLFDFSEEQLANDESTINISEGDKKNAEIDDEFKLDSEELKEAQGVEELSELFDFSEDDLENDEDITNLFDVEEEKKEDEQIINENQNNKSVNSIIANVPEEDFEPIYIEEEKKENPILKFFKNMRDRLTQKKLPEGQIQKTEENKNELKQEDYTQDVKPSFLERAKNALSNLMHRNKENIRQIDTAENNTKTKETNQVGEWDLSNYGTTKEEINKNTIKALNDNKQNQNVSKKESQIKSDETLSI